MACIRRIRTGTTGPHVPVRAPHSPTRLSDRCLGGKISVDYLFDLFAASPFEAFSRLSVLAVLDQVRKDQALFAEAAKQVEPIAARTGRLLTSGYFRPGASPTPAES